MGRQQLVTSVHCQVIMPGTNRLTTQCALCRAAAQEELDATKKRLAEYKQSMQVQAR